MSGRSNPIPVVHQIAPVDAGDFVTAFDIILDQEVLVAGMASGRVLCWKYPNPYSSPQRIGPRTLHKGRWLNDGRGHYSHSVRHIWVDGTRVCAVIGFDVLLVWEDITKEVKCVRFAHKLSTWHTTSKYLTQWRNWIRIYGCRRSDDETFTASFYDMRAMSPVEKEAKLLDDYYKVIATDDQHTVVYCRNEEEKCQFCEVRSLDLKIVHHHIDFPRKTKYYWGFSLLRNLLVYISNHNIIKILNMADPECDQDLIAETRQFKHAENFTQRDRLVGHRKHVNSLSIVEASKNRDELITIGMDHRLKIWRHQGNHFQPTDVSIKIPGKFNPGYSYGVLKRGDLTFYNADDGLFMVVL